MNMEDIQGIITVKVIPNAWNIAYKKGERISRRWQINTIFTELASELKEK